MRFALSSTVEDRDSAYLAQCDVELRRLRYIKSVILEQSGDTQSTMVRHHLGQAIMQVDEAIAWIEVRKGELKARHEP